MPKNGRSKLPDPVGCLFGKMSLCPFFYVRTFQVDLVSVHIRCIGVISDAGRDPFKGRQLFLQQRPCLNFGISPVILPVQMRRLDRLIPFCLAVIIDSIGVFTVLFTGSEHIFIVYVIQFQTFTPL